MEAEHNEKYLFFVMSTWSNINHAKAVLMGAEQYTNKHLFIPEL